MNGTDVPDIPDIKTLQDRMSWSLHSDGRPCKEIIVTGLPQKDISMKALAAVEEYNTPPYIFNRAGNRVWVIRDEEGNPIIDILNENSIRYILERSCQFYAMKRVKIEKEMQYIKDPIPPPRSTVQDIQGAPSWPLPPLEGLIECPYMCDDGTIVLDGGYNPVSKLFFMKRDIGQIDIPEVVTSEHVEAARKVIDDIFVDFPFVDDASYDNNIAALFTGVLRPLIPGITPLFMHDKPIMGSGASLLSKIIMIVALGRVPTLITAPSNDEEMEKKVMAALFSGMKIVVFDNCEGKVYFKSLASALTAEVISQRLFGKNTTMITAKNNVIWIINGNNIQLGGDLPRRCVPIRIDPKSSRPWQRNGFTHPDILEYVALRRHLILGAILTLAKGWYQAKRPAPPDETPNIGSYELWRNVIGGILHYAGYQHFLGNLERMYEESDVETPQWEAFLETWFALWGSDRKRVKDIVNRIDLETNSAGKEYSSEHKLSDVIPDFVLGDGKKKDPAKSIGRALLKIRDRTWSNGLKVIRSGDSKNTAVWRVLKDDPSQTDSTVQGGFGGFGGFGSVIRTYRKNISSSTDGPKHTHQTTQTHPSSKTECVSLLESVKGDQSQLTADQIDAIRKIWNDPS